MRWLLPLLLLGCPGETPETTDDPCLAGDDPSIVIGTGVAQYGVAEAGDDVVLVYGVQGGFHIDLAFETTHLNIDEAVGGDLTGTIGGDVLATSKPWLNFRCNPATSTQQAWGARLIYDAMPEELHLQSTDITATLTDVDGREVTSEIQLRIVDLNQETP